ncbi:MAG: 4Fe-4S binding protein [Thermodesulfobacteriota bacterium]|nr:4Fe-4S binding protein [Thermodesulfobacteriota bacterium]
MFANYGYSDGSGTFLITVDTDKCDGCNRCVEACIPGVLKVVPNEFDPFDEGMVVSVSDEYRKKIRYACAPCKPYLSSLAGVEAPLEEIKKLPCVASCPAYALTHSW